MKNQDKKEKSRAEIIIHELKCGGFADCELNEIIKACEEVRNEN